MKKLLAFLLFPTAVFAQSQQSFTILGNIQRTKPVDWVYLRFGSGAQGLDSVQPRAGQYRFAGKLAEPTLASLTFKYKAEPGVEKPAREVKQIFIQPGTIMISTSDSIENTTVKGSVANDDYNRLRKAEERFESQLDPLYAAYDEAVHNKQRATADSLEAIIDAMDQREKDDVYLAFLKGNIKSPVALYALKQYAGYNLDPIAVDPLFLSLPAATRQQPSARAFGDQIAIAKKTAIGSYAMDFTQNDTLGNAVSLSSFKGKYVLVDFWASWCGPCRRENPNVVKAFQQYRDRNFTVLGVSLDRPDAKEKWLAAIHKDGLTWTQVSDLQYWNNAVAKQYGIQAIPQNLLIDPDGKIIAKNIRGEALTKKLGEVLR